MAFGYVLIKAATYGGLYYTADFTATGAQPVWTRVSTTGLPALTNLNWLAVDPYNPRDRQVVLYNNAALYGRNGGDWSLLIDATIAKTATGGSSNMVSLVSPWFDPLIEGKLICFYDTADYKQWVGVSTDYGANWTAFRFYGGTVLNEVKSLGTHYWIGSQGNIGVPDCRVAYTPNSGSTLKYAANSLAGAAAGPPVVVDINDPTICYTFNNADPQLVRVDGDSSSPMTKTVMQEHIADQMGSGIYKGDVMWVDPYDSTHMRLLSAYGLAGCTLYATTDTWATTTNGASLGYLSPGALTHIQNTGDTTVAVLGSQQAGGVSIATLSTETDYTPEARSGANAGSAPYTDSIPQTGATVLARYGIWVGEQPVTTGVYVYSVEMESDTGWATDVTDYDKIGSPMGGDRSSFRDLPEDGFDVYHAEDVHAGTPQIHAPWNSASPPGAGYGIISDGTKWEVSSDTIALTSDLHDAVTLDADAAAILDLSTQEIGLDVQNANTVFAGPVSGAANEPTFRALVEEDISGLLELDDLTDVDTTGVGTGDILYKSSGDWVDYPMGVGIDIVNDGSSIKIGNISDGNFIQIDTDTGEIALAGDATAYEDLRVEPTVRAAAGAGVPTFEKYFDDLAGTSKGVYLYSFTDEAVAGNEKEIFFTMQMPHAWKVGSDISFHVHFVPSATVASSDIIWGLEYTWKGIGEVFGDTTIVYSSTTLNPDDANITAGKHYLAEFTDITPGTTASSLSSILIGRLFRNSSAAGDTYTDKVGLLYIDAHYQVDSFGSFDEYSKDMDSSLLLETGDVLLLETGDALLLE